MSGAEKASVLYLIRVAVRLLCAGLITFLFACADREPASHERLLAPSQEVESGHAKAAKPLRYYAENLVYRDSNARPVLIAKATPNSVGLEAARLKVASMSLAKIPETRSFLVLRRGKLVWEEYFHGAAANESRNVHSVSKSILTAVAGIALDRAEFSSVDQTLFDVIPTSFPDETSDRAKKITLGHLMTMTSGLKWVEDRTEDDIEETEDWVRSILALGSVARPGESFNYSTGSTHLLSAALTKATGLSTRAFTQEALFDPLGVEPEHWAKDPQGVFSGGCNLFLTPRELAKFGVLCLNDGRVEQEQIVPKAWLGASFKKHIEVEPGCHYGYGWWIFEDGGQQIYLAWGYGAQFVFVIPQLDLCIVTTADTHGVHSSLEPWDLFSKHIAPAIRD